MIQGQMEWYTYLLVILAGLAAGFINTIAGSGSLIVIPLLIFLGIPANIANGTNRIAILLQTLVATGSFKQNKITDYKGIGYLIIPSILGAIGGSFLASTIEAKSFEKIIGILLMFMFVLLLINPERWLKGKSEENIRHPVWLQFIIFFAIGFYGGFIQAGVGLFLLGGLVFSSGLDLIKANAVKSLLVLIYTVFALAVFAIKIQVDWKLGLVLSIGNMAGAWIAVKATVKWGADLIRYMLLVVLLVSALKLTGVF
jgi:uncharacterized protein